MTVFLTQLRQSPYTKSLFEQVEKLDKDKLDSEYIYKHTIVRRLKLLQNVSSVFLPLALISAIIYVVQEFYKKQRKQKNLQKIKANLANTVGIKENVEIKQHITKRIVQQKISIANDQEELSSSSDDEQSIIARIPQGKIVAGKNRIPEKKRKRARVFNHQSCHSNNEQRNSPIVSVRQKPANPITNKDSNIYIPLKRPGHFFRFNKMEIMGKLAEMSCLSSISSIENAIYSGRMNDIGSKETGLVPVSKTDQKFFKTNYKLRTGIGLRVEVQDRSATKDEQEIDSKIKFVFSPRNVLHHP